MRIDQLINTILQDGCGVDPIVLRKSKTFKKLLRKQEILFERYPENTHRGTMLRAGHLLGGQLLNSFSEAEAISRARQTKSPYGHGFEKRAMITSLGNELIKAAKENLPKEAHEIAKRWMTASAETQLELTHELFYLFTTESQRKKENMTSELAREKFRNFFDSRNLSHLDAVLPKQYGPWNKENKANCQGKTQMIAAFAEMVGANVAFVLPNQLAKDILENLAKETREKVSNDIEERGIKFPDPTFMDSMMGHFMTEGLNEIDRAFHICPLLQISDGRWVVIDSNALNWGVLDEGWQVSKTIKLLKKYEEVLPGLTIGVANQEHVDLITSKLRKEVENILERSRKLQKIMDPIENLTELMKVFCETGEFDFVVESLQEQGLPAGLDEELKMGLATQLIMGDDIFTALNDPQNYLEKKKGMIYTIYHSIAGDFLNDKWVEEGFLVHPELYLGTQVPYHVAIAAINSVGIDLDVREETDFFVNYSFCQTTLHNAMVNKDQNAELAIAAAEVTKSLPFQHKLSKRILNIKNL